MAKEDFYKILGIERDADAGAIKKAYRAKAMKYHPDRNPGDAAAEKKFKELNEANDVLSDDQKRADCLAVLELMKQVTGEPAAMGGKAIVGVGTIHYKGKSSEGDWPRVAFSPRKANLPLYLYCSLSEQTDLLEKLGTHKLSGKTCLQVKKLEDLHIPTLKKLIKKAYKSPAIAGAEIV